MSSLDDVGRRPVLAGIGAAALASLLGPTLARAQTLDRPPSVLVFDVAETLLDLQATRPLFLNKIAAPKGVKITAADRQELTDRFATMPLYPDVPVGLRRHGSGHG
jgi:hypothetical protein